MLWVPQYGKRRMEHNLGTVAGSNMGTAVTTGAASTTKGAVAQLIASTTFDAYWVTILASAYSNAATAAAGAMDILIGAATEDVLIPNLLFGYCGGGNSANMAGPKRWDFPLYIPAGSRLSCQAAGIRLSTAFAVGIIIYGGDGYPAFRVGSKVVTYGIGTIPNGTTLVLGNGVEGAWTQIVASSTEDHFALIPSFQPVTDTIITLKSQHIDVGYGAVTEEEVASSYLFQTDSNETCSGPYNSMPAFQDIPSGSRLVMRGSNNGVVTNYNAALHAMSA